MIKTDSELFLFSYYTFAHSATLFSFAQHQVTGVPNFHLAPQLFMVFQLVSVRLLWFCIGCYGCYGLPLIVTMPMSLLNDSYQCTQQHTVFMTCTPVSLCRIQSMTVLTKLSSRVGIDGVRQSLADRRIKIRPVKLKGHVHGTKFCNLDYTMYILPQFDDWDRSLAAALQQYDE